MRRVFLSGLGIGIALFWMNELDPNSMLSEILIWLLLTDQSTPLQPETVLFLYLTAILMVSSMLYVVSTARMRVSNHFDMLLCGMITGILLKWFSLMSEKEAIVGTILLLLGYYIPVYISHLKPGSTRFLLLSATLGAIVLLDGEFLLKKYGMYMAMIGYAIAMLGAFAEINNIRPIGAITIQTLPQHIMRFVRSLLQGAPKARLQPVLSVNEILALSPEEVQARLAAIQQSAVVTPQPKVVEQPTPPAANHDEPGKKKKRKGKRGRARKAETASVKEKTEKKGEGK